MRTCRFGGALTRTASTRARALRTMGNTCTPRASIVDATLEREGVKGGVDSSSPWLLARKVEIYTTAARVFGDYKLVSWRCDQLDDEAKKDELWDAAHERNSKLLVEKFTHLEALWIKLGQYLSSRADVMPAPFLRELSRCQDSLPAAPFDEVRRIIEEELGRPLEAVFASVNPEPLAVASIAAVHRATLLDGQEVVIKVQHAQVRPRLLADLKCLEAIGDTVRWLDADFDFSPVVREWSREVPRELDFRREAANMERVAANLAPYKGRTDGLGIDVSLATVIPGLTSERLLVMGLVDGFKVNDKERLAAHGVDKEHVMTQITRAYAQQIFGDGFYSGDPHPGNILVRLSNRSPVLLDFGLTKELSQGERYHFAKLIVAADEGDIHGLLVALEGVGLRLRADVPFDYTLLAKYFFRNAAPQAEAKEENSKRREQWRVDAEAKKRTLYVGDKVSVTSSFLGWRTSRNGEVLAVSGDPAQLLVRLTDGSEVSAPVSCCSLQKSRSPIDGWPDAFIFFERVLNLLRGLTASLDVNTSYLETMTPYARLSLQQLMPPHVEARGQVHGTDTLGVTQLLRDALAAGDALGCQVSVVKDGKALVELSAGAADPYERVAVEHHTLFCSFSVTKAVASAAVHLLAERGLLDLNQPVASYWPAFGANGKAGIRVCDVLAHKAGLKDAGTAELAADPLLACDSDAMMALVADATPDPDTLGRTSYHYLSFGWILEGLVRRVTGGSLRDFAHAEFGQPCGMAHELGIGLPAGLPADAPVATLVLQRPKTELPSRGPTPQAAPATTTASSGRRPAASPSLLLNPTYFNNPRIREASLPSANGHFTARALTAFYGRLHASGLPQRLLKLKGDESARGDIAPEGERMLQGDEREFVSGFVLYDSNEKGITFGHSGLGGATALCHCDTATGATVCVAVTLNRLTFDSQLTRRVVRHAFMQLKLPVPPAFARD